MVNRPKKKGTAAETRVVNELTAAGLRCFRVVQKGNRDQGDIHILGGHGCVSAVLEVKAGKQTQRISRQQQQAWLHETRVEAANVGNVHCFLIIAKHGTSTRDYYVWSSDGHRFWYLDEFAEFVKGGF